MSSTGSAPKEQRPQQHSYKKTVWVVLCCMIFIPIFIVLLIFYRSFQPNLNTFKPQGFSAPIAHETPNPHCEKLKYQNQTKLDFSKTVKVDAMTGQKIRLSLGDKQLLEQLTHTNSILHMEYDDEISTVAYIAGDEEEYSTNIKKNTKTGEQSLHLFSLTTNKDTTVMTYPNTHLAPNGFGPDYDSLNNFAFSPDNAFLFVDSNKKIWRYSLATKQLRIISANTDPDTIDTFSELLPSPDNSVVFVYIGRYEQGLGKVLNLSSLQFTDTPYGGYGPGAFPTLWYGSKLVYLKLENKFSVCIADAQNSNAQCSEELESKTLNSIVRQNNSHITLTRYESVTSPQQVCNNVNNPYFVSTDFAKITDVDLNTLQTKTIFNIDVTVSSGVSQEYDLIDMAWVKVAEQPRLFIKILDHGMQKILMSNSDQLNDISVVEFE